VSSGPVALGPASRLRRRYADAPADALRAFGAGRSSTARPARFEVRAPGSLDFSTQGYRLASFPQLSDRLYVATG